MCLPIILLLVFCYSEPNPPSSEQCEVGEKPIFFQWILLVVSGEMCSLLYRNTAGVLPPRWVIAYFFYPLCCSAQMLSKFYLFSI